MDVHGRSRRAMIEPSAVRIATVMREHIQIFCEIATNFESKSTRMRTSTTPNFSSTVGSQESCDGLPNPAKSIYTASRLGQHKRVRLSKLFPHQPPQRLNIITTKCSAHSPPTHTHSQPTHHTSLPPSLPLH